MKPIYLFAILFASLSTAYSSIWDVEAGTFHGSGFIKRPEGVFTNPYSVKVIHRKRAIVLYLTGTGNDRAKIRKIFERGGIVKTAAQMFTLDGTPPKGPLLESESGLFRVSNGQIIERQDNYSGRNIYSISTNRIFIYWPLSPGSFLFSGHRAQQGAAANP